MYSAGFYFCPLPFLFFMPKMHTSCLKVEQSPCVKMAAAARMGAERIRICGRGSCAWTACSQFLSQEKLKARLVPFRFVQLMQSEWRQSPHQGMSDSSLLLQFQVDECYSALLSPSYDRISVSSLPFSSFSTQVLVKLFFVLILNLFCVILESIILFQSPKLF